MIEFHLASGRRAFIVQSPAELPRIDSSRLYLDCETNGLFPYLGHRACGVAVTMPECNDAWYVPYRHVDGRWNMNPNPVRAWLRDTLGRAREWVNHNVKFDAHVLHVDGVDFDGRMVDTYVLAKLYDSDRMSHGLKQLCKDLLGQDTAEKDEVAAWLKGAKIDPDERGFADVPADLLGRYACQDVFKCRDLHEFLAAKMPEDLGYVVELETKLTPVLFDMEREGMRVDVERVARDRIAFLRRIIEKAEKIGEIANREYADSAQCNYDILVNQLGLPVLAYNDEGNPTFDGDALALYTVHPEVTADPKKIELLQLIIDHRRAVHFKGLFLDVLWEHQRDGVVHPDYNQVVRTGRMSCRRPNAQQFSEEARELVVAAQGEGMLCADASQVEFRIITHYTRDASAIAAYMENPRTDFHQYVADQSDMKRKPAKTLNFSMAFGAGMAKTVAQLMFDPTVAEAIGAEINAEVEAGRLDASRRNMEYRRRCQAKGQALYLAYHERFPNIRSTSNLAARLTATRGYVKTAYGRRRHLPLKVARKAFNAAVQGTAGDYCKSRMVALAPRYEPRVRELGLRPFVQVHDELGWYGPAEVVQDVRVQRFMGVELANTAPVEFRVPFRWDQGVSTTTWAAAGSDAAAVDPAVLDAPFSEAPQHGAPESTCDVLAGSTRSQTRD